MVSLPSLAALSGERIVHARKQRVPGLISGDQLRILIPELKLFIMADNNRT
jgi:hypothetical protein